MSLFCVYKWPGNNIFDLYCHIWFISVLGLLCASRLSLFSVTGCDCFESFFVFFLSFSVRLHNLHETFCYGFQKIYLDIF